jgi:hypothetical protein
MKQQITHFHITIYTTLNFVYIPQHCNYYLAENLCMI